MTDTQLYIAVGIPIIVNIIFNGTIAMLMSNHFNARLDALDKLFMERLRRVEEVLDARLKHLEEP